MTSQFNLNIFASHSGSPGQQTLLLITPSGSTGLKGLTISPVDMVGGATATGTVTLSGAAPSGGAVVTLSKALANGGSGTVPVTIPASVAVPPGQTSASFAIESSPVTSTTVVRISATYDGTTLNADMSLFPSSGGGGGPAGFLSPTANAPDSGGDGNGFQTSPVNAYVLDGAVATDTNSGSGTSTSCTNSGKDRHRFYNFGFSIPDGAAIAGIEVRLDARADGTSGSPRMCVQLSWDGGANWTAAKTTGTLGTSLGTFTLGGATDTWGRTWSATNLTNANFRLRVINVASSTSRDFFLDWIAVRPHLAAGGSAALNTLNGNASVTANVQ